jgi:amidase
MHRRDFVGASLLLAAACSKRQGVPVEEVSLAALSEALHAGRVTSSALIEAYLARIESFDRGGPKLNSVIERNLDAPALAARLDEERKAKGPRSPLHGIPILIKDNIDTADKMKTTAGSLALEDAPAPRQDAPVVARLRAAGAVILGKTNLSEWANIRSSRSTSGWSGRGGLTRNPYALDRNPSGSSSGSGVAVAASLCAAAVGTETDGSIVSPSSLNGIVGIKPTLGLLSGKGIIPIAHSQDTAGPMARTVRDAAMLLTAMNEQGIDYTPALDAGGLKGARLGVVRQFFGANPRVEQICRHAMDVLRQLGAELVDPVELPPVAAYGDAELDVMLYELKADLNAYLASRGAPLRTLEAIIAFNEKNSAREMPHFGQEHFLKAREKGNLDSKEYLDAREKCKLAAQGIDSAMEKNKLDALIAPTDGPAWLTDFINGDHFTQSSSTPAAVAGYPHITVPAGSVYGLPVGLSFFGRAGSEARLIRYAYAFEQTAQARRPPAYPLSVNPA